MGPAVTAACGQAKSTRGRRTALPGHPSPFGWRQRREVEMLLEVSCGKFSLSQSPEMAVALRTMKSQTSGTCARGSSWHQW